MDIEWAKHRNKELEAALSRWEQIAQEGHPDPCTLGPMCPYCEIERLIQTSANTITTTTVKLTAYTVALVHMRERRSCFMYNIFLHSSTKFTCSCMLQDGTEVWDESTLEAAIAAGKHFAKFMNGTKIKKKHIRFWKLKEVTETKWEEYKA